MEFKDDENNKKNKKLAFLDLLLRTGSADGGGSAAFTDADRKSGGWGKRGFGG